MGKRIEREKNSMTTRVNYEEAVDFRFEVESVPKTKRFLDLSLQTLEVEGKILSKDINIAIAGSQKVAIIGKNGVGKTTLLKKLIEALHHEITFFFMEQNFLDTMPKRVSAVQYLSETGDKDEISLIRTRLGSPKFTANEMLVPIDNLSGGQQMKLFFAKMSLRNPKILFLDETTRNLSPLTRPVIINALKDYKGAIVAVSHDRDFIQNCFSQVYELNENGLFQIELKR